MLICLWAQKFPQWRLVVRVVKACSSFSQKRVHGMDLETYRANMTPFDYTLPKCFCIEIFELTKSAK